METIKITKNDLFNSIKDNKEMQETVAFQLYVMQIEKLVKMNKLTFDQALKVAKFTAQEQFESIFK